jgi:hypothetical protein
MQPTLKLGVTRPLSGRATIEPMLLPAHHLVTHGVVLGMTGSGKTGLITVLIEEATRNKVPILVIDIKGDLPNLLLRFPSFATEPLVPWVEGNTLEEDPLPLAEKLATERKVGITAFGLSEQDLVAFVRESYVRVITPGADAGELLHVLSALERRSGRWDTDVDGARSALSAAVSLVLRLLGRDPDPAKSREHVFLSLLAERRLLAGQNADIAALLADVVDPPISEVGALEVDAFLSKKARKELAAALNTLLASPSFASWRQGGTLDVGEWMKPVVEADGVKQSPITVLSVAHLDDDERALVLGLVLEEVLSWVRGLPGSQRLRALLVFDEVYGFLPPHPANPPTKKPLVALMKQARAFGVGVVIATQNPMDLDYRSLSNAGLWCLGRLQTDADRARVLDGLINEAHVGASASELDHLLKNLRPRWFVTRNAHSGQMVLMQPRWAMTFMRGPMTRTEIKKARRGP